MPAPVSSMHTATKSPRTAGWLRIGGMTGTGCTVMVRVPSPSMASRALTAMFTRAVSNWLGSALMKQGSSGRSVTTLMREPLRVPTMSLMVATLWPASKTSGFRACRRAKASN